MSPNLICPLASLHISEVPLWLSVPFGLLLLLIAVMPLSPDKVKHWWEHYYAHVSVGLGLLVSLAYFVMLPQGGHHVVETLSEYFSFISLIGSLFVVAGGILIRVKGEATPLANVVFLALGAVLANLIGTTGASMVLIRPFIRMNRIRISSYHVVFFIFLVSNCGGALTPVGDPPLFLGFLRGVPFFWLVEHVLPAWLFTIGLLLGVFYVLDQRAYAKIPRKVQSHIEEPDTWQFQGGGNVLLLFVIIGAVFLPDRWFVREVIMLGAAFASWKLTPKPVHEGNHFNFGPIREVAFLFVGIFLTMMPALGYLKAHGRDLGFTKPAQYYFASGSLSSVLDNAPTYLNFLQLAQASFVDYSKLPPGLTDAEKERAAVHTLISDSSTSIYVIAVSLGSVFFGAMTYIGNGPNFMVKSIADSAGVRMPGFFGYILRYSLPLLFPILLLTGLLFL